MDSAALGCLESAEVPFWLKVMTGVLLYSEGKDKNKNKMRNINLSQTKYCILIMIAPLLGNEWENKVNMRDVHHTVSSS